MSLAEGQRLGPYEVLGRIGAGGMGEVYRARDTRLDRTVALKVLPGPLSGDGTSRARFEREARAISALAHPHICTLFDIGEQDGLTFLVMEHLEGQTLLERLQKGPLPLAQAVEIAISIAEALSAAHKQGIVHRDLKPGNVMLTKSGAKLLDFGLARLIAHGERPAVEGLTAAPTEPAPLTGRGTILGTLPYMAPEQLEGKPVDARTDLWALGVLIYEMLTGRRAFEGKSQVSLIGAILEREPEPISRLQPLTPPSLERLVRRCLAKSPDDRWDTAHDVADELRWIADAESAVARATSRSTRWTRTLALAAFAIACLLLGGLADRWWRPTTATASIVVRALLDVQPAEELNSGGVAPLHLFTPAGSRTALEWTPDGRALVFVGRRGDIQQVYVRDLASQEAHPLANTDGAQAPAISTDGGWVAFWADEVIKRIPILGGPTSILASRVHAPPTDMAWGSSGRLYFGRVNGPIWRVAPETAPEPVTTLLQNEISHGLPQVLPGEKALLFTVRRRAWTWGDEEVVAQDLATGTRKVLLRDAVDARYVAGGYLVFMRQGVLMAAAFDLARLSVRGEPVPILEGVGQALTAGNLGDVTGAGQFSVSSSGTLAYVAGPARPYRQRTLVAIDREGRVSPLAVPAQSYLMLGSAPDGRRLAVVTTDTHEQVLWILDAFRGTFARLAGEGEMGWPRWTPDGERVAYDRLANGVHELVWQRADDTAPAEPLVRGAHFPSSWSPDGLHLATVLGDNIWIVTLASSMPTLERLLDTTEVSAWPEFSPDGRWLAYASDATGRMEVYIQAWPGRGPRTQVSLEGGEIPVWNPRGGELFFMSGYDPTARRRMWVVDVETSPRLRIGTPRRLFDFSVNDLPIACGPVRCFAVSPDGRRFFGRQSHPLPPTPPVTQIHLIQGWLDDVKARVGREAGVRIKTSLHLDIMSAGR